MWQPCYVYSSLRSLNLHWFQPDTQSAWCNKQCHRSLQRSEVKASGWLQSTIMTSLPYVPSLIFLPIGCPGLCNAHHIVHRRMWYCALSLRHARTMCVFDVRASSSPIGYLCAKFNFCRALHWWTSSWRKIAYSLTHSPSLFNDPGTKGFASGKLCA